jgi:hypothetical protein
MRQLFKRLVEFGHAGFAHISEPGGRFGPLNFEPGARVARGSRAAIQFSQFSGKRISAHPCIGQPRRP